MTKSHPIRTLLQRAVLSGRLARWLLQLSEYEITPITPTTIKSQAIAEMMAQFPSEDGFCISDEVPGEVHEIATVDHTNFSWTLRFDGSSVTTEGGAGIVLSREGHQAVAMSFKLGFPCSNNAEPTLTPYRTFAQKLEEKFNTLTIEYAHRSKPICGCVGSLGISSGLLKDMRQEAATIQGACPTCQNEFEDEQVYAVLAVEDWRMPFFEYLFEGILPEAHGEAYKLKRQALRYFTEGSSLFKKGLAGEPLRCLGPSESQVALKEAHARECGEHQGKEEAVSTVAKLRILLAHHEKGCRRICQNLPHMPEYFTKWVEAIPLKKATGVAIANFIRELIICRFGIPHKIVTDNGTPFINKDVRAMTKHYRVKHLKSSPYYPQELGLSSPGCVLGLPIIPQNLPLASPHSLLVYGIEAIAPLSKKQGTKHWKRLKDTIFKMVGAYGKIVKERIFATGQLVLKAVDYVRRGLPSPSKFASNWEGSYVIREAHASGYYKLVQGGWNCSSGPSEWEVVETLLCLDSCGGKPFVFTLLVMSSFRRSFSPKIHASHLTDPLQKKVHSKAKVYELSSHPPPILELPSVTSSSGVRLMSQSTPLSKREVEATRTTEPQPNLKPKVKLPNLLCRLSKIGKHPLGTWNRRKLTKLSSKTRSVWGYGHYRSSFESNPPRIG
uniref:Integrase catalytic domain-containing protein n=1 Tax=Fagus sylvatica TaxID=28930 RepID=A0A2N9HSG7_FAGSY